MTEQRKERLLDMCANAALFTDEFGGDVRAITVDEIREVLNQSEGVIYYGGETNSFQWNGDKADLRDNRNKTVQQSGRA
jgi:hypothetical protein